MLDVIELLELEEIIREQLNDSLEEILVKLNCSDKLEEFLVLIGLNGVLGDTETDEINREGKIIVIGDSQVKEDKLVAIAKSYGIDRDRFEFYLNYEDAKMFDFRKTQWSSKYSCILVGEMPHSGKAKEEYSSIIKALEQKDGYPPVIRVGMDKLKITKSSFRNTIEYLVSDMKIA